MVVLALVMANVASLAGRDMGPSRGRECKTAKGVNWEAVKR